MFLNYNQTSGSCSYKIDCYLKKILKIVPGVLCNFLHANQTNSKFKAIIIPGKYTFSFTDLAIPTDFC